MRKGRYHSYSNFLNSKEGWNKLELPFILAHQGLRMLIGRKTNFEKLASEEFTDVDAANMRKNLAEIILSLTLVAIGLALKAGVDDDDSREGRLRRARYNLYINMIARLTTDIQFYVNPLEFERLLNNALPIFTLVTDGSNLLNSSVNLLAGRQDILQSGPDKGKSRTARDLTKMIPGPVQWKKIKGSGSRIYKEPRIKKKKED